MIENEQKIVSVHIPKTGGVSVGDFFANNFGCERTYFYYGQHGGLHRADKDPIRIARLNPTLRIAKDQFILTSPGKLLYKAIFKILKKRSDKLAQKELPEDCLIVHGHFPPSKFENSGANLITAFREPLDRTRSHYNWLKERYDGNKNFPVWFDPNISFEEFALSDRMTNFQSKYIEGRNLSDFSHLGVTTHLDLYCAEICPDSKIALKHMNRTSRPLVLDLSDNFIAEFKTRYSDDIRIYNEALEKYLEIA